MPGWNCQKSKQKLTNILRLNICFLNVIHFLQASHHPKIVEDILKNIQKTSASLLMRLLKTMKMTLKMKNMSNIDNINEPRPRHGHKDTKYKI